MPSFCNNKKNRCKQQIICVSFVIKAVFSGKKKAKKAYVSAQIFIGGSMKYKKFSLKMGVA